MNVLVTGANGFVGQVLIPCLEKKRHRVRKAVRFVSENQEQDESLVAVGMIEKRPDWSRALEGIECIVHLAARAHILKESAPNPLESFRQVNVEGTKHLATMAAQAGVKRFVFISSIGVHGNSTPNDRPLTEDAPIAPASPYALSKWEAECALRTIANQMEIVIIRPPLVYGPGVKGNFLRLLAWVAKGWPLPFASITNRRSLVGVDNLCDFISCCLEHPRASGQAFVICDEEVFSLPDLIRHQAEVLECPAHLFPFPKTGLKLLFHSVGKAHLRHQLLESLAIDASKAQDLLNWRPPYSADWQLQRTASWFRQNQRSGQPR